MSFFGFWFLDVGFWCTAKFTTKPRKLLDYDELKQSKVVYVKPNNFIPVRINKAVRAEPHKAVRAEPHKAVRAEPHKAVRAEPHKAVRAEPRTTLCYIFATCSSLFSLLAVMFSARFVKRCAICVPLFLVSLNPSHAQDFQWNGYLKYLPTLRTDNSYQNPQLDQLVHQRFNAEWQISEKLSWNGSLRTRFFYGDQVKVAPQLFAAFVGADQGAVDATWNLYEGNEALLTTTSDRFYLTWQLDDWIVRAGRQRVNWAISTVFNPNDLFNAYNFFDFDYEERPGADAIQIQYFPTPMSRVETVISLASDTKDLVAAGLYAFNRNGYDVQVLGGLFHNRIALGGGWAGSLGNFGFKGEATLFRNTELFEEFGANFRTWNLVATVGTDYLFGNGLFLMGEYLYNQSRLTQNDPLFSFTQPLRADQLSFSEHVVFTQASYPINPIMNVGLGAMLFPTEEGFFLTPTLSWNAAQNLSIQFLAQYFFGAQGSLLEQAGFLTALVAKWNF